MYQSVDGPWPSARWVWAMLSAVFLIETWEKWDTIEGERVTRYIALTTDGAFPLVINPYNFRTIAMDAWPGHVEDFYCLSPWADRIPTISILRFLDVHSSIANFATINEFPNSDHLDHYAMPS